MSFTDIKKLLNPSLYRNGIKDQVYEKMAMAKFEDVKEVYFGKELAQSMRPMYLKWSNLMVACLTEEAAKRIEEKEDVLVGIINAELEISLVKSIKCLL